MAEAMNSNFVERTTVNEPLKALACTLSEDAEEKQARQASLATPNA